jgi:dUTPase
MVKVKTSKLPKDNILTVELTADRYDMPNRFTGDISTGFHVQVPSTHCLRVALVPELANRGLLMTSVGRFTQGEVKVHVINAGREIISIRNGDPLLEVWLEKLEKFTWEQE